VESFEIVKMRKKGMSPLAVVGCSQGRDQYLNLILANCYSHYCCLDLKSKLHQALICMVCCYSRKREVVEGTHSCVGVVSTWL
jgi:hypothetical protein